MSVNDPISQIADIPGFEKQVAEIVAGLTKIDSKFVDTASSVKKLNEAILSVGSFKEFNAAQKAASDGVDTLVKTQNKAIDAEAKLAAEREKAYNKYLAQLARQQAEIDKQAAKEQAAMARRLADIDKETAKIEQAAAKRAKLNSDDERFNRPSHQDNQVFTVGGGSSTEASFAESQQHAEALANEKAAIIASIEAENLNVEAKSRVTAATIEENSALIENIEANIRLKGELVQVTAELKAQGGTDSQLIAEQLRMTAAIRENNAVIQQQIKQDIAAEGAFTKEEARLKELTIAYSNLSKVERETTAGGLAMKAEMDALDVSVKANSASMGQFGKQVGTYESAIGKALGRFDSLDKIGARVISNIGRQAIRMGVEFAAWSLGFIILEAFGDKLSDLAEKYRWFKLSTREAEQEQKIMNDALASSEYTTAISNVTELTENIKLAKQGFLNKTEVVKEYNDTIGKTTGKVNDLNEAEAALNKNASAFIEFTLKKAVAQAALKDATDAQYKAAQIESKTDADAAGYVISGVVRDLENKQKQLIELKKTGNKALIEGMEISISAEQKIIQNASRANKDDQEKDFKAQAKTGIDVFKKYQDDAAAIAKKNKFDFFGGTETAKGSKKSDSTPEDNLKTQAENFKKVAENEKNSYDTRILAAQKYYEIEGKLLDMDATKRLKDGAKKKDINTFKSVTGDKNKAEFDKLNDKIEDDRMKRRAEIIKANYTDLLKASNDFGEKQLVQLSKNFDEQEVILADRYAAGKLSKEDYEREKLQLTESYNQLVIEEEIAALKRQLSLQTAVGEDSTDTQKKLDELEIKSNKHKHDVKLKDDEDAAKKRLDQKKREEELLKGMTKSAEQAVEQIVNNVANSRFEARKQAVDDRKQQIDEQSQAEIDAENRSLDSSKTKADKIAIINAKAAAQKKLLDKEEKKIAHDKAIFDREIAVAKILFATGENVARAFPNPFLIAAAVALGALETTAVLTAPLPAFKQGGTKKGDGLALFGEIGTELRVNPDGKVELTPDTPTVGMVKSGTRFIDSATTMKILANPEMFHRNVSPNVNMETTNQLLRKLIEKDSRPRVNITVPKAVYWWRN